MALRDAAGTAARNLRRTGAWSVRAEVFLSFFDSVSERMFLFAMWCFVVGVWVDEFAPGGSVGGGSIAGGISCCRLRARAGFGIGAGGRWE
jgi:hypothetical protein